MLEYYKTRFLRIEFICIIWTPDEAETECQMFLRIEFICIIWTQWPRLNHLVSSWGLNLFVLFERSQSSFQLRQVLEDWIYLYYLNRWQTKMIITSFLRIEFICIIWTDKLKKLICYSSWGLNLFVLFEQVNAQKNLAKSSWGLNLFVLFELVKEAIDELKVLEDWIYLYYLNQKHLWHWPFPVLEDWIYLYYLNKNVSNRKY